MVFMRPINTGLKNGTLCHPTCPPLKTPCLTVILWEYLTDGPKQSNYTLTAPLTPKEIGTTVNARLSLMNWTGLFYYLNISDPHSYRSKDGKNCYIVEQTCYDDSCEPNQTIFYRPAEKEGCGPAAPRDEWLKSTKGDGDTFHGDLYGSDFKRDRQLRQKLGIPFEPCRHEECKID